MELRTVAGAALGQPHEDLQLEADRGKVGLRARDVGCVQKALPAAKADVVVAPLQHRHRDGVPEETGEGGQIPIRELLLQVDGMGRDDGAFARPVTLAEDERRRGTSQSAQVQ